MGESIRRERGLLGADVLGQLDTHETDQVTHHLTLCPACREELHTLRATSELLRWYVDHGGDI